MTVFNTYFPTSLYGNQALNVKSYGAIADGSSHPLSSVYGTLAAAQVVYPFATALTQELDYCACKLASNTAFGADLEITTDYTPITSYTNKLTIIDATANFTINEFAGKMAFIKYPHDFVMSMSIVSNTATVITVASEFPFGYSLVDYPEILYAIGYGENGLNSHLNKRVYLPAGMYQFGDDTWTIRNLVSGVIEGDGRLVTKIMGNATLLAFDGIWYSRISDLSLICSATDAVAGMELDGNIPGHAYATRGVQGVTLSDLFIEGGGSTYALTMTRQGGSNGQGSECAFINCHLQNASIAPYYQNGFNALANTFFGGNFQNYPKHGILVHGGTVAVINTGFQSTAGYTQYLNDGWDISVGDSGAYEACIIYGCRTESLRFLYNGGAVRTDVRGCVGNSAMPGWFASTPYGTAALLGKAIQAVASDGISRLYVASTEGTSGGSVPTWPTSGTVADGTIVWTETPFNSIHILAGSVDLQTVAMRGGGKIYAPPKDILHTVSDAAADYQIVHEDIVVVDCTSGANTIYLPRLPQGIDRGRTITVKKSDTSANALTVDATGSPGGFEDGTLTSVIAGGSRGYRTFTWATGTAGGNRWHIIDSSIEDALIVDYTDSITLAASDRGKIVEMNKATAVTVTVPPNSSVAFPIGTEISVEQIGAGQVTFVAGSGVTIRSKSSFLNLAAQYSAVALYKRGTNEWVLVGDLA